MAGVVVPASGSVRGQHHDCGPPFSHRGNLGRLVLVFGESREPAAVRERMVEAGSAAELDLVRLVLPNLRHSQHSPLV